MAENNKPEAPNINPRFKLDMLFDIKEAKRHREYYAKHAEAIRINNRNYYRRKHKIPLDQPVRPNKRRIP